MSGSGFGGQLDLVLEEIRGVRRRDAPHGVDVPREHVPAVDRAVERSRSYE
ncbi:hypothetical protein AB1484_34570 [Parafrankia sp. FMc6]|uniref:hypothetical protein n=1 Tax=Parafrankia soli TaxID=2599596 RepID=UPI0034D41851